MTPKRLFTHIQWRTKFLRASSDFTLAGAGEAAATFREVEQTLAGIAKSSPPADAPTAAIMQQLTGALAGFTEWVRARAAGESDADRHRTAAATAVAIAQEALPKSPAKDFREAAEKALQALTAIQGITDVGPALKSAAAVPFPPCLLEEKIVTVAGSEVPASGVHVRKAGPTGPFAIRVMLTLDGKPWANPQRLHPATTYGIDVVATVPAWPEGSDRLVLDVVTTLPGDLYRISPFVFEKPAKAMITEFRAKGHIEFQSAQSLLSEPAVLQMRATFRSSVNEKEAKVATVIGYHKLRARIMDPKQSKMLSKYSALDLKIVDLLDPIRDLPGLDQRHLDDFVEALSSIANYLGLCAQSAVYRAGETIPESEFQKRVLVHLRGQLGEEVQEAPKQGAGITDIVYRTVTIELKVETTISDRAKMVAAYEEQTTQYASSRGAQLGILCVLDLTEKDAPPAPTQNNLMVMTPKLHGFPDKSAPAPVRVVAAIIDGNLRSPSDYSR